MAVNTISTSREATSDWSLLERIAQQNEVAFSALYDRYCAMVFSTAKRILHRTGETEEILQDVFYQVWCTAERFDQARGSLAGWLLVPAAVALALVSLGLSWQNRKISLALEKQRQPTQALLHDREETKKLIGILSAADTVTVKLAAAGARRSSGKELPDVVAACDRGAD
jgi:hypothetical protein